ncbi:hypothetical protein E6R60_26570 [Streptomyces sp. A0642]|uniref:hypothetical protein n=1 Tax=Streptomyces sp. A0642 TaxID=2563100 RepID=UPI0010A201F3|nr:hypothetical protein [Streptomyces sp. A0642]THA72497.1 hypothetical protein E6R60_26570 [Streptomyces sp. A0642]
MPAYMSRGAGVVTVVRTEHRVDLRMMTLALYHSNEELGADLAVSAVRTAISSVLGESGTNVLLRVSDYIREGLESDEDGSLVGSTTGERLDWARHMVLKAYRRDFAAFPDELARFAAAPVEELV